MKPIHNLLRERLYRTQKPLIEHPPIDLLSAFAERALSGPDRATVLQHLAQCVDCREIAFLAAPELILGAEQGSNRHSPLRWVSWPVFRWGTVAACAVIVVAAVSLHPSYRRAYSEMPVVQRQNQPALQKSLTEPTGEKVSPGVSAVERRKAPTPAQRLHSLPGKAKAVPEMVDLPQDDSFYRQMTLLADVSTDKRRPPPRWTLTADGTVQRSLDGGISWKQIHVARSHVFRAVAAAGRSVWLGGQKRNSISFDRCRATLDPNEADNGQTPARFRHHRHRI